MNDDCAEERATHNPITYIGNDIDHVEWDGAFKAPMKITMYLKDGQVVTLRPVIDISERGIRPQVDVKESTWAKLG
jgi:hypothetical protein